MINSEFRFPLFDSLLYGSLNPFLPANHYETFIDDPHRGINPESISDPGVYAFTFYLPTNFKCTFYYHKLIQETFWYCHDVLEMLDAEQDMDSRAYLRLSLLDKHLKTCLIKTGEIIRTNDFTISTFINPTPDSNFETISNAYIFQLLKVCLAKAYLEVQEALKDVVFQALTEAMLYTAVVGELPPVKCYLKKLAEKNKNITSKDKSVYEKPQTASEVFKESNPEIIPSTSTVDTKFHTVKDLVAMKIGSERTIRRMIENLELNAVKGKKGWLVTEIELQRYLGNLKMNTLNRRKK
ncbi:MAG TPA: hypothetical protein VIK55_08620 [Paludibacter sp.]